MHASTFLLPLYKNMRTLQAVTERCSIKKAVLKIFATFKETQLCQRFFSNNFIKKQTLAQVLSCEFC